MIRVKLLQSDEVFVYYLVGLCAAGRNPLLHIISTLNKTSNSDSLCCYDVIIEFRN